MMVRCGSLPDLGSIVMYTFDGGYTLRSFMYVHLSVLWLLRMSCPLCRLDTTEYYRDREQSDSTRCNVAKTVTLLNARPFAGSQWRIEEHVSQKVLDMIAEFDVMVE